MKYLELLRNEEVVMFSRTLARALGVGPAIILHQVEGWIRYNASHDRDGYHTRDGRVWTYGSYSYWADRIGAYSVDTIKNYVTELEEIGLLVSTSSYNRMASDRTKWYSVEYETYTAFMTLWEECGSPPSNGGRKTPERVAFEELWRENRTNLPMRETFPDHEGNFPPSEEGNFPPPLPVLNSNNHFSPANAGDGGIVFLSPDDVVEGAVIDGTDSEVSFDLSHELVALIASASGAKSMTGPQMKKLQEGPRQVTFVSTKTSSPVTVTVPSLLSLYDEDAAFRAYAQKQISYIQGQHIGSKPSRTRLVNSLYDVGRSPGGWLAYAEKRLHRNHEKADDTSVGTPESLTGAEYGL